MNLENDILLAVTSLMISAGLILRAGLGKILIVPQDIRGLLEEARDSRGPGRRLESDGKGLAGVMRVRGFVLLVLSLGTGLSPALLHAQVTRTGFGTVVSATSQAPVTGATVRLAGLSSTARATAAADGSFVLDEVPSSVPFLLEVTASGFVPTRLLIAPGADASSDDAEDLLLAVRTPEGLRELAGSEDLTTGSFHVLGHLHTPFLEPAVGATLVTSPEGLSVLYLDASGVADPRASHIGVSGGFLVSNVPAGSSLSLDVQAPNLDFPALASIPLTGPAGSLLDLRTLRGVLVRAVQPRITSIRPSTLSNLTTGTLRIEGADFLESSRVFAAGRELEVTGRSESFLQVRVPPRLRPGPADLRVENGGGRFFAQLREGLTITGPDDANPAGVTFGINLDETLLFTNPLDGVLSLEDASDLAGRTGLTTDQQLDNVRLWLDFAYQNHVDRLRMGGVDVGGRYLFQSDTLAAAGYPRGRDITGLLLPELRRRGLDAVAPLELIGAIILDAGAASGQRPLTMPEVGAVVRELAEQGVSIVDEERFDADFVAVISDAAREAGIEHIHFFFDVNGSGTAYGSEEYLAYPTQREPLQDLRRRIIRQGSVLVPENTLGLADLSHAQARELGRPSFAGTSGSFGFSPPFQKNVLRYRAATDRISRFSLFSETLADFAHLATSMDLGGQLIGDLNRLLAAEAEERPIANLVLDSPDSDEALDLYEAFETSSIPAITNTLRAAGLDVRPTFGRLRPEGAAAYYILTFGEGEEGFDDLPPGVAGLLATTDAPIVIHAARGVPPAGRSTSWDSVLEAFGLASSGSRQVFETAPVTAHTTDFGSFRWAGPDLPSFGLGGEVHSVTLIDPVADVSSPGQVLATGLVPTEEATTALVLSGGEGRLLLNGAPLHLEASTFLASRLASRTLFRSPALGYAFLGRQSAFLATEHEPFPIDLDLQAPAGQSLEVTRYSSHGELVAREVFSDGRLPPTTLAPLELLIATAQGRPTTAELPLYPGLNLVSLPVAQRPPARASALVRRAGARFVARLRSVDGGRPSFQFFHANLGGDDFPLEPGRGYFLGRGASPPTTLTLEGEAWPPGSGRLELRPGLALLGLPRASAPGASLEDLAHLTGSGFIASLRSPVPAARRFSVFIPGLEEKDAPALRPGEAYLVSVPNSRTVTLPGSP